MYAYLKGILVESSQEEVVVEVNSIGYLLSIPERERVLLPALGSSVHLYTSLVIRENAQTLFGFLEKSTRDLFEWLITLSGIGPKTALGILGHLEPEVLRDAATSGSTALLTKVPGIGKKTAERLLIDLRAKLSMLPVGMVGSSPKSRDALQALLRLGYPQTSAERAVKEALVALPDSDLAGVITYAIKAVIHK